MQLLDTFIAAHHFTPFAWGRHDCCTFAADWVLVRTGRDPMAALRGLFSPLAAMRALRRLGGFVAAADALLGNRLAAPALARPGDVCLVSSGRRPGRASGHAFGVCLGSRIAAPGPSQLVLLPITSAEASWRV